jgi:predicted glycosyltransferase
MNREAAALGVPVYSIFRGKLGAVDKYLADTGRLTLIKNIEDVRTRIRPVKRTKPATADFSDRTVLTQIMAAIDECIAGA